MTEWALAIDSTLPGIGVGLFQNGEAVETEILGDASNSAHLLPMMTRKVINAHGLSMADLAYIAVAAGPGSFTGIRSGLAFAHGIRSGSKVSIFAASSIQLLANDLARQKKSSVTLYLGSTQEWGYCAFGIQGKDDATALPISITQLREAAATDGHIGSLGQRFLLGDWATFSALHSCSSESFTRIDYTQYLLDSLTHLAEYGQIRVKLKANDPLLPIYLRPPTVVERLTQAKGKNISAI